MAKSNFNFNVFAEIEKLRNNGSNFTKWFRILRIILAGGQKDYVLEKALGDAPAIDASADEKAVYQSRKDDYDLIKIAMLFAMESNLQNRFEEFAGPFEILEELKNMFQTQARSERYEISKKFFNYKMEERSSVSEHAIEMTGYTQCLEQLDCKIPEELKIDTPSYKSFVVDHNQIGSTYMITELFAKMKVVEVNIKKNNHVLMVNKPPTFKKGKGARKPFKKGGGKRVAPAEKKLKSGPKPDTECFYCKDKGHWKRNCPKYLADKKAGTIKGIFDIHVIDVFLTIPCCSAWVFDTGSVANICNSKQELRNRRRLARDEATMRVGNGSRVDVMAVGTLSLVLPSGLVLNLNKCYYVPALSMNIISGSCLLQDGYSFKSENNGCSIYMSNIFYGHAPIVNGLFLLNLERDETHIHNIEAKRCKVDSDNTTYLWHCRLGHIGVKRMKKLHSDGLLESLDFESFDTCEPCLMGKMIKTPFSGMMERATDLLEIIHTDVCGPMSVSTRGGYRYFLTFTDDLSRYGYIYLMKHKSETFEKFKEFQNEVENHRNKKIKFLRSDRGGEYLSYEFGLHLKQCGIVSQLTPPGTPQRNGVSECRNRTLLDMVRSMMSLTDLPLSFWGYALETTAFTLNRASSKSLRRHRMNSGLATSLSCRFLKVWGCDAFVKRLQSDKLTPKSDKYIFVGYPRETLGYYFYNREEGKVFVARSGVFLEKEFLTKGTSGRSV